MAPPDPPLSDATILIDITNFFKTQYRAGAPLQYAYFGGRTNRFFNPAKTKLGSNIYEVTLGNNNVRSARMNRSILDDPSNPGDYSMFTYDVRINSSKPDNDLTRLDNSMMISEVDRKNASGDPHQKVNLVDRLQEQHVTDVRQSLAIHRHLDADGSLADVDGAPKDDDDQSFNDCTAYTPGGVAARFKVKDGVLPYFSPGQLIDIYDGATPLVVNDGAVKIVQVTGKYETDGSIGISVTGTTPGDLDTVVDGNTIYNAGEKDESWTSMGEWFEPNTTIYQKDRSLPANRILAPQHTRLGSGIQAQPFNKTMLDEAGLAVQDMTDDGEESGYRAWLRPDVEQAFRDQYEAQQFVIRRNDARLASLGYTGAVFRHPAFGDIAIDADPLARPGRIRLTKIDDWETVWDAQSMFNWIPGTQGMWYRVASLTNKADTYFWRADGYMLGTDICVYPRRQIQINKISSN